MNYKNDKRIVLTLDAGGTNFVFSAIQSCRQIVNEIWFPAEANSLDKSLSNIVCGFARVLEQLTTKPTAISVAFPGPADYPNGILGDLGNMPSYRGGVALGPMLQDKFNLPVFVNNDGDLYAYGEAIAGFLPYINGELKKANNPKHYKNLLGLTLGTGFGSGIVHNGELYIGDNSMSGEICFFRNKILPDERVEELASIRGVQRIYSCETGISINDSPSPKEIFEIGVGEKNGNKGAAVKAYKLMAQAVGDVISQCVALLDCLVVIGGGLAGAHSLFMPFLIEEMNSSYREPCGTISKRLIANIFNLENESELQSFVKNESQEILVYCSNKKVVYDPSKKIGISISKIGTSKAISMGAYTFALNELDNNRKFT